MAGELTNILTESGTNEVEVLVFQLADGHYGVNVAKVREIIEPVPVSRIAHSHPAVRGLFQLRGNVLPLVDLRFFFDMPPAESEETSRVIVMEFNNECLGFLVDHVDRIHRTSWKAMSESPWSSPEGDQAITSVLRLDEMLVLMLDFERVAFKIAGVEVLQEAAPQTSDLDRGSVSILLADDSATMRRMLGQSLATAGFKSVEFVNDGQEAWDRLDERLASGQLPDIVVTDIEMPRMDGLHLTKRIKTDPRLNGIPVIVFSSLVSDDNLKKCEAVGADRQLTKPQLPDLVQTIDSLLSSTAAVV